MGWGVECTLKSTLTPSISRTDSAKGGSFYLIRILLPLIWLAMSVIASLLERDIFLHRDEMSLRRIANGCLAEEREVGDGVGLTRLFKFTAKPGQIHIHSQRPKMPILAKTCLFDLVFTPRPLSSPPSIEESSPPLQSLACRLEPCPTQQVSVNVPILVPIPSLKFQELTNFPAAPPEDQARLLEEALAIVRAHATSMKRCIDKLQILDSLKHASMMLAELRSSSLGPKHYYELCMAF
jgi:hypothetical protein